jgi:hypothetical protein
MANWRHSSYQIRTARLKLEILRGHVNDVAVVQMALQALIRCAMIWSGILKSTCNWMSIVTRVPHFLVGGADSFARKKRPAVMLGHGGDPKRRSTAWQFLSSSAADCPTSQPKLLVLASHVSVARHHCSLAVLNLLNGCSYQGDLNRN